MNALARRSAGALARVLVVLLTLGTSLPFATHGDAGHDPCDTVQMPDAAGASLHAVGAGTPRQHCDVCHWLRSLRAFDVVVDRPAVGCESAVDSAPVVASSLSQLTVRQAPSRAPPA